MYRSQTLNGYSSVPEYRQFDLFLEFVSHIFLNETGFEWIQDICYNLKIKLIKGVQYGCLVINIIKRFPYWYFQII